LRGRDLSSMRRGNLYPIMAPDVRPADPQLRHTMLGMTEAGSVITISEDESDQPEHRRGSFGKLAPGFETKVVDGELCIRGPYVMQRYYKRVARSASTPTAGSTQAISSAPMPTVSCTSSAARAR
jgi:acyl-CoA synthetase (AMP-forming)/AMP-acid ligase II